MIEFSYNWKAKLKIKLVENRFECWKSYLEHKVPQFRFQIYMFLTSTVFAFKSDDFGQIEEGLPINCEFSCALFAEFEFKSVWFTTWSC